MKRGVVFVIYVLILFVLGFALARFLEENSQPIQLRFYLWRTKEIGLATLVSLSFLGGVILSSLFLLGTVFAKTMEAKRLRRENLALQKMMELKEAKDHSSSSK